MVHDPDLVSIQEVRGKVERAYSAWTRYRTFSQSQIDAIVEAVAQETEDAPGKETARVKKEADDLAAVRQANLKSFRP